METQLSKKMPDWLIIGIAFVFPGMGHVLLGKPMRGLVMDFWMVIFGFVTYQLSTPDISWIGRISGGLAVWTISVLEISRFVKKRNR